jgi:hypothetical protein
VVGVVEEGRGGEGRGAARRLISSGSGGLCVF